MSRKKLPEGMRVPKARTFNSLLTSLEDPRSLINLLPEDLRAGILTVPEELLNKEEDELAQLLKPYFAKQPGQEPTAVHDALRMNFWYEYDRVVATKDEMINAQAIYMGVCTRTYWFKIINECPHIVAWILCRPIAYDTMLKSLHNQSTKRLRDFLNIPLIRPDGDYQDPKILDLILKAAAIVDLRVKGGYIQRSETKNLTLMEQRHTKAESIEHVFNLSSENMSAEEISTEIKEKIKTLEQEVMTPVSLPQPKHRVLQIPRKNL